MKREDGLVFPLGRSLDFLERTWRVNHAMERLSNRMAREVGVTGQQRLVVRCVGAYPGLSAGQLAKILHLDRGTISAALNRLEERGLIERRADLGDRRRVTLALTRAGRAMDLPVPHTIEATVERCLRRLSEQDVTVTTRVLSALATALEQAADRED